MKECNRRLGYVMYFGILPAAFLSACGNVQPEAGIIIEEIKQPEEQETSELPPKENSARMQEPAEPYQQMLLYIREGLYKHGIESAYQAYFSAVEDDGEQAYWRSGYREAYGDGYFCEILLEGDGILWSESLAYTYDDESGWYTFYGQFEPVLVGDPLWKSYEDSDNVQEIKANYVYTCQISGNMDLSYPMKYIAENAPAEDDMRVDIPLSEAWRGASGASEDWLSYGVYPRLYTYVDDRLDMYVTISYPEVTLSGTYDDEEKQKMEDNINELIKEAFFYAYETDDCDVLDPRRELYGNIQRNYIITRRDENYLSMRIYESHYFRGANHPNQWETAITMDMQSGRVMNLGEVVGAERTVGDLFGSGAFRCMWYWRDGNEEVIPEQYNEDYLGRYKDSTLKCSQYGSDFYITDKTLGLITTESRYYTNVEADFADLGISEF